MIVRFFFLMFVHTMQLFYDSYLLILLLILLSATILDLFKKKIICAIISLQYFDNFLLISCYINRFPNNEHDV